MMAFILLTTVSASSLFVTSVSSSESSPYDSGYNHGCDDAGVSNPSDRYINQPEKGPSFHTQEFMSGYYDGLNGCGSGQPPLIAPPLEEDDGGDRGDGGRFEDRAPLDEEPQTFDEVPSRPRGGEMDWTNICNTLQPVLFQSCSELVNPDGTFTFEGQRAYDCISNGILLTTGGGILQLPLPVITAALRALETPTGCGGIVDWSSIDQVSNLGGILRFFR